MAWVESFDAFVRTHLPALRVEQDAKMAHYTSFRIGGGARRMAFPRTEEDVERYLELPVLAAVPDRTEENKKSRRKKKFESA